MHNVDRLGEVLARMINATSSEEETEIEEEANEFDASMQVQARWLGSDMHNFPDWYVSTDFALT